MNAPTMALAARISLPPLLLRALFLPLPRLQLRHVFRVCHVGHYRRQSAQPPLETPGCAIPVCEVQNPVGHWGSDVGCSSLGGPPTPTRSGAAAQSPRFPRSTGERGKKRAPHPGLLPVVPGRGDRTSSSVRDCHRLLAARLGG